MEGEEKRGPHLLDAIGIPQLDVGIGGAHRHVVAIGGPPDAGHVVVRPGALHEQLRLPRGRAPQVHR